MTFALTLKRVRESTPDPERPNKHLTQERMAQILGIKVQTIRAYEQDLRLPHSLIRKQIELYFPSVFTTTE